MRRPAVLVALPFALGSCATSPGAPDGERASSPSSFSTSSSSPSLPPAPGIAAEAVLLRTDEAVGGRFQVRITATGNEPFGVRAVALAVPGLAPLPPTPVTAEFVRGRVIDLPAPYGRPDCAVAPEPAAARLAVVRGDGPAEEVTVPLTGDVPARVHAQECAGEAVAAVAELAVTVLEAGEEQLTGRLALRRTGGDEPLTVGRIGRSVLVDVEAGELPARLEADAGATAVPLTFRPATCEPHVLTETKQPYVFPLEVAIGDASPVVVDLPVDDALRVALGDLVRRVCGGA
ncbi:hypothetical protein [Blastococcus saxobsidens]|uniref:Lipoprotein n=1 Tax=Blastococcus saxobsidens TaxID=138336 RepID=A0A4Q7Y8U8_9ACTN|nr:hypothetical protein [Blastococcus saxobsidens]RZU33420.1 hypothetical protein BKA19_3144 [Blastococcus saxobsidens]